VSENNKIPPPPPDDFSKTTPNIRLPERDAPASDWDAPDPRYARQPAPDEWGKTVTNLRPIDTEHQDMNKTFYPGSKAPSTPEWGMTEPNINVNAADLGTRPEDFRGNEPAYDKTMPYFRLPEAEQAKYQNLPPTPVEQAAAAEREQKAKGGLPTWFWVAAGLMTMFFFTIVVFAVVYFFILRDTSFEVTVKGAPPGSTVQIDGSPLAVTDEDGSFRLKNLKAGEREVSIVHPTFTCEPRRITGGNGTNPEPIIARCTAIAAKSTDDCGNIRFGEDDKAERCYNSALDALSDPFTVEDLLKALNILIINFESGKSDIPPVRLAALQKGASYIKKLPQGVVIEVGGHTDNVGQPASNQTLSEARANAVKAALIKYGVADSTLQTRGYGATKPITTNDTVDGKFRNRRIEYSVVKK
jgi:outer membrane protein OmpA-like peptidoglycan-associated protein